MTTAGGPSDLLERLRGRVGAPRAFEKPRLFDVSVAEHATALRDLLGSSELVVQDELAAQVAELLHARDPRHKRDTRCDQQVAAAYQADRGGAAYGTWVYFPWRHCVVRVLPEAEFVELRSARNQLHITAGQQRELRAKTVGIVGLSVGYSMALTFALEGVGGRFRLADYDALELSNTNRVPCGITGLGHNKAALAARAMFEIDPYLDIEVYEHGITPENHAAFFTRGGHLDVLIEECDDLPMKLRLREQAKKLGVPVLTETSQGGVLDLERYDIEPSRPPFHGLMGKVTADQLGAMSTREKAPFALRFMEGSWGMSTSLMASLVEIEHSLAGWPQLASAVTLGGAVATDATRRVLLGALRRSGRFRVDLGELIHDDAEASLREVPDAAANEASAPTPEPAVEAERQGLERWVQWAGLAPSGGNVQPWEFHALSDGRLACRLSARAQGSALDPDGLAARLACGAAYVNLELAAGQDGMDTHVSWEPDPSDPELLYTCRFEPNPRRVQDELASYVEARCTNRRVAERWPLDSSTRSVLEAEAAAQGGTLCLRTTDEELARAAEVLGELERVRVFSQRLYAEMMTELADEPGAPMGIALETLELTAADRVALEILRQRDVVDLLRAEGRGAALAELAAKPVRQASAVCVLHVAGTGSAAFLQGGRALQRTWLRATQQGLAVQPVSAGLYMLAQSRQTSGSLPDYERRALQALQAPFDASFPVPAGRTPVLLFRLAHASPPSARSRRLPLDQILRGRFCPVA